MGTHLTCSILRVSLYCLLRMRSWTLALAIAADTHLEAAPTRQASFIQQLNAQDPHPLGVTVPATDAHTATVVPPNSLASDAPQKDKETPPRANRRASVRHSIHSIHSVQGEATALPLLLILSFRPLVRYKGLFVKTPPDYDVSMNQQSVYVCTCPNTLRFGNSISVTRSMAITPRCCHDIAATPNMSSPTARFCDMTVLYCALLSLMIPRVPNLIMTSYCCDVYTM